MTGAGAGRGEIMTALKEQQCDIFSIRRDGQGRLNYCVPGASLPFFWGGTRA